MKIELHSNSITIRATDRERTDRGTEYRDGWFVDDATEVFSAALASGDAHTLVTRERIMAPTGLTDVTLVSAEGVPGNSDPDIRATEGWRGTTNDIAVHAHGLVRITNVDALKRGYGYRIAFERVDADA